jgi:uncharacterized protein (TIGR03083 family)
MLQKPAPILIADRFPSLLDALLTLLAEISTADWERPTAAAGWAVKDMALHLLGDDIGLLSDRRDGYHGGWISVSTWEELVAQINRSNAAWVESTRRLSPRLLCDLLRFSGEQVNAYFGSLDPFAIGVPVSWAGPDPAPVWLDVAREFTERWHHQQHIRQAVERPGLMDSFYLAPVLAAFVRALPRTFQNVIAPEGTLVSLTITGEAGGSWSVLREQDQWQLFEGKPPEPQAEVSLPEDAAWRLFTRGISKDAARSRALLSGDIDLAEKLLETVSIIA